MADMLGNLRTTAALGTSRAGAEAHSRDPKSPLQAFMGVFTIVKIPPFWLATTTKEALFAKRFARRSGPFCNGNGPI